MGNENKTRLFSHWDADGISASYFASYHVPNAEIVISEGEFGDVSKLKKGDWLIDQHPLADFEGTVLDHHLGDGYPLAHKYKLIYDTVPATLIAWREFKEDIPKDEWFKVVVGLMGDGQPELIPAEVFKECPQLLNWRKTSAYKKYNWTISYYPTYKLLSSPINAFLRKGD